MLYLIGIGLGNERDLTLNALDVIKNCEFVYLENYTSYLGFDVKNLEELIGKGLILADRNLVENTNEIIDNARNNDVVFLVKGDVFSATTHSDLFLRAKRASVECKIFHNASVLTAISDTGLSLYKFGKTVSLPFDNKNLDSPYELFLSNWSMHTLFLLDLIPNENRFMDFKAVLNYLLDKSNGKQDDKVNVNTQAVVCAGLGTDRSIIKYGRIIDLLKLNVEVYPQSVIIPGELHFMEEEVLDFFKI